MLSSTSARLLGSFIRPLRRMTMRDRNRETRWDREGQTPTGFGGPRGFAPLLDRGMEFFYHKLQTGGTKRSPSTRTPEHERMRSLGQRGSLPKDL
jgi:hydrogenase small subunit